MYKICKSEQSARRQREIEEGLLALLQEHRAEDISVSQLCQRLDIPRKAFYRYFAGMDGALTALMDHTLMSYEANTSWQHGFAVDLDSFFQFWLSHKPLLDALQHSSISGMLVERAIWHTKAAMLFATPGDSPEYAEALTTFVVSGLMSMMLSWHREGYRQSPEEMAAMARRMLGSALVPGMK